MENVNESYQKILQEFLNYEMKQKVFAAFPKLKEKDGKPSNFAEATKELGQNSFYKSFVKAGGTLEEFSFMYLEAVETSIAELRLAQVSFIEKFTTQEKNGKGVIGFIRQKLDI